MTYTPKEGEDARTRDGRRVTDLRWLRSEGFEYWEGLADGRAKSWYADGAHKGGVRDACDIVGPWEGPPLKSGMDIMQERADEALRNWTPPPDPLKVIADEIRALMDQAQLNHDAASFARNSQLQDAYAAKRNAHRQDLAIVEKHMGDSNA